MNDKQELEMLAYLKIIAQNTAVIAAQVHLSRPLTGSEYEHCVDEVQKVAESLQDGLEIAVLPPGGVS